MGKTPAAVLERAGSARESGGEDKETERHFAQESESIG
jgi:hypothetical protein